MEDGESKTEGRDVFRVSGHLHDFALVFVIAFRLVPCEINSNTGWDLTVKAF